LYYLYQHCQSHPLWIQRTYSQRYLWTCVFELVLLAREYNDGEEEKKEEEEKEQSSD
jgi:hypothetical protein